ncbi:MAG: hypothetical protein KA436_11420 [Oligoflexales bacterium]|nr:hypothetical protein [Oligoflexales bacterium]
MKPSKKILLSAALSGLFAASCATPGPSSDSSPMGECHSINGCKGKGECGGKGHACAGKNECKGVGWVKMSKADCDAKKGKFVESKM